MKAAMLRPKSRLIQALRVSWMGFVAALIHVRTRISGDPHLVDDLASVALRLIDVLVRNEVLRRVARRFIRALLHLLRTRPPLVNPADEPD